MVGLVAAEVMMVALVVVAAGAVGRRPSLKDNLVVA
jgi:hypothetical protein